MHLNRRLLFLFIPLLIVSCKKDISIDSSFEFTHQYLHVSHMRLDTNPHADADVEQIDYSKYDLLLLGGDLANLSSADDSTMNHLDSIFNLSSYNTLWSLGNHDYSDLNRVENYTGRKPYYAYSKNGITFLVLDTQDSLSSIVNDQLNFFNSITDTLNNCSHLIILHHKLIWMRDNGYLESIANTVSNGELGDCFYCINPNNFYSDVYPTLVSIQNKGIKVICIGGDIGFKTKSFDYTTSDDIRFMASGIDANSSVKKVLLLKHNTTTKELVTKYTAIQDLD